MTRSHRLSPADLQLWRHVTESITPLARRGEAPPPAPAPAAKPADPDRARPTPSPPPPRPRAEPKPLDVGVIADLDRRSAERLKRGEMEIDGRLDLHGLTQADAHAALNRFLAASQTMGRRCVLVITGKGFRDGNGVLKAQVPQWLAQAPNRARILAVMPARPQHGGAGALYVLVKRLR